MQYHPIIRALDAAAAGFHELGMMREKTEAFRLAGVMQQQLLVQSSFDKSVRFLDQQWVWALGHIGLLHQLIRWFRHVEPDTRLVLETNGSANNHFLAALQPYLTIVPQVPDSQAAMSNAVYFGCPDGRHALVDFYKMIERECEGEWLLALSDAERQEVDALLDALKIKRPFIALQARGMTSDSSRNVTLEQVEEVLEPRLGWDIVSVGLDPHPVNDIYPNVLGLPDPQRASFLLSAGCDQYIGSNSGAWTIAHAYQRPVVIMNDHERAAWIYP